MPSTNRQPSSAWPAWLVIGLFLLATAFISPAATGYGLVQIGVLVGIVMLRSFFARLPRARTEGEPDADAGILSPPPRLPSSVYNVPAAFLVAAAFTSFWTGSRVALVLSVAALVVLAVVVAIMRSTKFSQTVHLTVGADGVFVRRLGAAGFLPWREVRDLALDQWDGHGTQALHVVSTDGTRVRLGSLEDIAGADEAGDVEKALGRFGT